MSGGRSVRRPWIGVGWVPGPRGTSQRESAALCGASQGRSPALTMKSAECMVGGKLRGSRCADTGWLVGLGSRSPYGPSDPAATAHQASSTSTHRWCVAAPQVEASSPSIRMGMMRVDLGRSFYPSGGRYPPGKGCARPDLDLCISTCPSCMARRLMCALCLLVAQDTGQGASREASRP